MNNCGTNQIRKQYIYSPNATNHSDILNDKILVIQNTQNVYGTHLVRVKSTQISAFVINGELCVR